MIIGLDDGHPTDVGLTHAIRQASNQFLGNGNQDFFRTGELGQADQSVLVVHRPSEDVGSGNHADEFPLGIGDWIALVPQFGGGKELDCRTHRHRRRQSVHIANHHVLDANLLEGIDALFPR
jgi:hypothetical protein